MDQIVMDQIDKINQAIASFECSTGIKPTRLYIGDKQWTAILNWNIHLYKTSKHCHSYLGLEVIMTLMNDLIGVS